MKRALRCFGFVALGIAMVAGAALVLFGAIGALFWLSDATARLFDMPQNGLWFLTGYAIAIFGAAVGGILCAEDRS